ncbi:MAG: DMT family transporter [Pseudomonadota bacterium]
MYHRLSQKSQGILWAIITCFLVSVMIAVVRHLSEHFHPFQIVMMRNFFALVFLLPFVIKNIDQFVKTSHLKMHLIRGVVGLAGMLLWFYVITLIPLSEAVSITFIVPITTTIAAMFFLGEKVDKKIWISLTIGLIGVLIIIRPGFREFKIAYLLALLIPFVWSVSNILIKKMVATEKPQTITLYLSFVMFILSIPIAAPYLKPIPIPDLCWFLLLGLISNCSYIANAICYSKTDVSTVQPFDFTRLIFTAIIAYFAFGEKMELMMFIGAAVILFGSLIVASKSPLYYLYSGFAVGFIKPKMLKKWKK